ncbi:nuclear transport factor 2 family protein [Flagellimonas sp. HMM57]|uniref:nuclear transport factor 2 family protein n=1 Tax=unclassified Flagellimonas TaxID=2644544 RepID=UPI0013D63C9F|nr:MULTISPECIES: nuclear transport factor 2 family protein [unclassified Flagellimonas]UII77403.1 nuclear transport factor 2 family protein [Flagellimonas sp. HMM57]
MRKLILILFVFTAFLSYSQDSVTQIQEEINREVWKRFKIAFETLDGIALNSIYADEVLRVTPQGIDTESIFKSGNLERFQKNKADGMSIALDFWFDSRHTNESTSYEVGFYRIGFKDKAGVTNYSYGQFHIVLKKIDGTWKITQDWDTTNINGKPITAEDLAKKEFQKF